MLAENVQGKSEEVPETVPTMEHSQLAPVCEGHGDATIPVPSYNFILAKVPNGQNHSAALQLKSGVC